jgi:predicted ATPase
MTVRRYVLTGAPGSGKTTMIEALRGRGATVVAEAATEVIARGQAAGVAEPWTGAAFLSDIVRLQVSRQRETAGDVVFFDRSPLCTLALARYSQRPVPVVLRSAVQAMAGRYEREVFLVRELGFVERTAARRISYADAVRFGAIHEDVYAEHGYVLVEVPKAPVAQRVELIERVVQSSGRAAAP